FSSRRRHTRFSRDWVSDVCSSAVAARGPLREGLDGRRPPRQGGARGACRRLGREPGPKDRQAQPVQSGAGNPFGEKVEQRAKVRSEERRVGKERSSCWGGRIGRSM